MIYVGIDDTDTIETRGTNQLARLIVRSIGSEYRCLWIARHQLLLDPRVPYTSKNGCASIVLEARNHEGLDRLATRIEAIMRADFIAGSDPGLCIADQRVEEFTDFGRRCQMNLVPQIDARRLATKHNVLLRGLGGSEDGVIGALAAVGLAMSGNDGRVIQVGERSDDLSGKQSIEALREMGLSVRTIADGRSVVSGSVDLGKKLRPALRDGGFVLFVEPGSTQDAGETPWLAIKLL